jgi:hypothetical protein
MKWLAEERLAQRDPEPRIPKKKHSMFFARRKFEPRILPNPRRPEMKGDL